MCHGHGPAGRPATGHGGRGGALQPPCQRALGLGSVWSGPASVSTTLVLPAGAGRELESSWGVNPAAPALWGAGGGSFPGGAELRADRVSLCGDGVLWHRLLFRVMPRAPCQMEGVRGVLTRAQKGALGGPSVTRMQHRRGQLSRKCSAPVPCCPPAAVPPEPI